MFNVVLRDPFSLFRHANGELRECATHCDYLERPELLAKNLPVFPLLEKNWRCNSRRDETKFTGSFNDWLGSFFARNSARSGLIN